jgi:hypothetical protein
MGVNMTAGAPPPASKIDRIIDQNNRLTPLWDSALKIGSALLALCIPLTMGLWTVFSNYLGHIGQVPLPTAQASEWAFLLVFSFTAAAAFGIIALIPVLWRKAMVWNGLSPSSASSSREYIVAGLGTLLISISFLTTNLPSFLIWMTLALVLWGCICGWWVARRTSGKLLPNCLLHIIMIFALTFWLMEMWLLLAPVIEAEIDGPFLAIAVLAVIIAILMCACFTHAALGLVTTVMVTGFWLAFQADPNGGMLIPKALYTANLGGGRPANIAQADVLGEICNLGVEARPVLVFERCGCEWSAAAAGLRQLRQKVVWNAKCCCEGGPLKPRTRYVPASPCRKMKKWI